MQPQTLDKLGYRSILKAALEYIRTPMGKERIESLRAYSEIHRIRRELELSGEMMSMLNSADILPLETLDDIRPAVRKAKAEGAVLDPFAILGVLNTAVTARRIKTFLKPRNEQFPGLFSISINLIPVKELEEQISAILTDQGEIKDSASAALRDIRRQLAARKNELREAVSRLIRRAIKNGMMDDQEATIRDGRMVIPVKAEFKRKIAGFVHDVSATGQTVYLEPVEVLNINNDIRELEGDERREIEILLRKLTDSIRSSQDLLNQNIDAIGQFDEILAKARLGILLKASIPNISEKREIYLIKARNPILLLKYIQTENSPEVVPLTLELNQDEKGVIITGPNAGGKSVALKTIGLCQMMVQSGFPIPADEHTVLPAFPSLFVDMGDEQSIENDLSTFSSRLYWMKEVLDTNPEHSLVLIDEAGSGTDPDEGTVLYQAFMEMLIQKDARIMVTTHHGALKIFANETPHWVNASMEFNQQSLSPTYRFRKGIPGSSFAFEIAGRLGVQPSLVERSRQLIGPSRNKLEALLADIEDKAQQTQKLKQDLEQQKTILENQRRDYEAKESKLIKQRDAIIEQALEEAQQMMQTANARIEQAVRAAADEKTEKDELKQIRHELDEYKREISGSLQNIKSSKTPKSKTPPKIGDTVKMPDGESTGELLEISGRNATVLMSGLRVRTNYKNLIKVSSKKKDPKPKAKRGYTILNDPTKSGFIHKVKPTLNIRGFRKNDALKEVMNFIDRAVSSGLKRGEIIHGHGHGVLKKAVHEYLQKREEVKNFKPAPLNQGGDGCTIVEFK